MPPYFWFTSEFGQDKRNGLKMKPRHGSNTFPKWIECVWKCKGRTPIIVKCNFALKANAFGSLMESQGLWGNAWISNFRNYYKGINKNYSATPCFSKTNLMAKGYGHLKKRDGREKFDSHSFKPSSWGIKWCLILKLGDMTLKIFFQKLQDWL